MGGRIVRRNLAIALLLLPVLFFFFGCIMEGPIYEQYALNVSCIGEGAVEPSYDVLPVNTIIVFKIKPDSGWMFDRWEGENKYELQETSGVWQITMTSNKNLTAVFKKLDDLPQPGEGYSLQVSLLGKGAVTPNSGNFEAGEFVNLTVCPDNGWTFNRWEGPNGSEVYGGNNNYSILMNANKVLIAVFQEDSSRLDISLVGNGRVEERLMGTDYAKGSLVRLRAIADNGWFFKEWRGHASGNDEIIYLELDSDKAVTAVFAKKVNNYTLRIDIQGQGTVEEKLISVNEYEEGSIIQLTAKAKSGWKFKEWQGDVCDTSLQVYLEIDGDKQVIAVFVPDEHDETSYYLGVTIEGSGTVTKSPDFDSYKEGELVTLTAKAARGWKFISWHGDASGTRASVRVTMDRDKEVRAIFELEEEDTYNLEVQIKGNGKVLKSPDKKEYMAGEKVSLTASADSGWEFREWQGDLSGSNNSASLTMNEHKKVSAIFIKEEVRYRLHVNLEGNGSVIKKPDASDYLEGSQVTLTALPTNGWLFKDWTGDVSGANSSVQVIMDRDKNVTASFEQQTSGRYTITTSVASGSGTIRRFPDQKDYAPGTEVILQATPSYGFTFTGWEINGQRQAASSIKVKLEGNIIANAFFVEDE